MALTINRNNEITQSDFSVLKERFQQKTNSQALYQCVEFVLNKVPEYEKKISSLELENNDLKIKHNQLLEIIKKKQFFDQELDSMVHPMEKIH